MRISLYVDTYALLEDMRDNGEKGALLSYQHGELKEYCERVLKLLHLYMDEGEYHEAWDRL